MIKAVIFDYFGVIATAQNHGAKARMAEAYGISEEIIGPALGKLIPDFRTGKTNEQRFWGLLSEALGKPIPENTHDIWRVGFKENLKIDAQISNLAKDLKSKGLKVGVLSNTLPPWAEIVRDLGGFADFDDVVLSCEIGLQKPDIKIYELALNNLKISGPEAIFVDDRPENIKVAKSLGMQTVLAVNFAQVIEDVNTVINTSQSKAE